MGHENIWFAHKGKNTSGKGYRHCRVNEKKAVGLIKKYGLSMSDEHEQLLRAKRYAMEVSLKFAMRE